jgi:hypothetical protein
LVFINENGDVIGRNNYSISETFYWYKFNCKI